MRKLLSYALLYGAKRPRLLGTLVAEMLSKNVCYCRLFKKILYPLRCRSVRQLGVPHRAGKPVGLSRQAQLQQRRSWLPRAKERPAELTPGALSPSSVWPICCLCNAGSCYAGFGLESIASATTTGIATSVSSVGGIPPHHPVQPLSLQFPRLAPHLS